MSMVNNGFNVRVTDFLVLISMYRISGSRLEELHIYGFRYGRDEMFVWILPDDMPTPEYNSSAEYERYVGENGFMHATFKFYEEPQFGNWGVAAGIMDRLAKNNAETQFYRTDPILLESIEKFFQLWFGPTAYLTEKLYPN